MAISAELLSFLLYVIVYAPGIIAGFIINVYTAPRYHVSRPRAAIYTGLMDVVCLTGAKLGAVVYNWFQTMGGRNPNFTFAVYGAIFLFLIVVTGVILLEKAARVKIRNTRNPSLPQISLRDTMDMLENGAFILVLITKARCALVGCCHGFPCDWGVWSTNAQMKVFPVQYCEMAMTLSILILCHFLKRRAFYRRGMAMFLAGGMFSFGRFFLEFIMYYIPQDRVYLGCLTFWQCASILAFLICTGVVIYLYKTQPPEPLPKKEKKAA